MVVSRKPAAQEFQLTDLSREGIHRTGTPESSGASPPTAELTAGNSTIGAELSAGDSSTRRTDRSLRPAKNKTVALELNDELFDDELTSHSGRIERLSSAEDSLDEVDGLLAKQLAAKGNKVIAPQSPNKTPKSVNEATTPNSVTSTDNDLQERLIGSGNSRRDQIDSPEHTPHLHSPDQNISGIKNRGSHDRGTYGTPPNTSGVSPKTYGASASPSSDYEALSSRNCSQTEDSMLRNCASPDRMIPDSPPDERKKLMAPVADQALNALKSQNLKEIWNGPDIDDRTRACVYRQNKLYFYYAVTIMTIGVVLLSADQNLASPHLTAMAGDFFRDSCAEEHASAANVPEATEKCIDDFKIENLGGEAQFGFFILGGLCTLVIGPLADVWNRVKLLCAVIWCGSLPCCLTVLIPNGYFGFYCFMLQRILTGISVGGSYPVIFSLFGDMFPSDKKVVIGTIVATGTAAGVGSGTFFSGMLGEYIGWRLVFCGVAAPSILVSLIVLSTVIEPLRDSPANADGGDAHHPDSAEFTGILQNDSGDGKQKAKEKPNLCWRLRRGLFNNYTTSLCFAQALPGCVPWAIIQVYLLDFLHHEQDFTMQEATYILGLFMGTGSFYVVVSSVVATYLSKKNPRFLAFLSSVPMFCIWFSMRTVINTPPRGNQSKFFLLACLGGLGAVTGPTVKGLLLNCTEANIRGTVFGIMTLTDDLGKGFAPLFIAHYMKVWGHHSAISLAFDFFPICGVINAITFFTISNDFIKFDRFSGSDSDFELSNPVVELYGKVSDKPVFSKSEYGKVPQTSS